MSGAPPVAVLPTVRSALAPGCVEVAAEVAEAADPSPGRVIVLAADGETDLAPLAGVVTAVEVVDVGGFGEASVAAGLAPVVEAAPFVLTTASPAGRDLAPRLAAELGWPVLAGALRVGATEVIVARQGGVVQETLAPDGPFVATLQPGVRSVVCRLNAPPVRAETLVVPLPDRHDAEVVEIHPPDPLTVDLADAPRIVGGGAGLLGDDPATNFATLTEVGAALGASMGATRVVTDAGWVPHQRQIGTTGVVVDPELYLAFGISGAVQHTAGLGHPAHVVSVNLDPHCPMSAMADLSVVADAPAVLAELAARLASREGSDGG
jgi:electron transfer flavoprotein alpha subunit